MYLLLLFTVLLFAFHPMKANGFHHAHYEPAFPSAQPDDFRNAHNDLALRSMQPDNSRNVHNDLALLSVQAKVSPHVHYGQTFHSSVEASDSRHTRHGLSFRPAGTSDSIFVQTLNIYSPFYAENRRQRETAILKFLEEHNSDIIFFQEVWFEYHYKNMEKVSQFIGMNSIGYDVLAENEKQSGLVTIVKGDIHKKEIHFFPLGTDLYDVFYGFFDINKGFGIAHIVHPKFPNTPFWAVNTHLHHLSQNIRLLQLVHYLKWFLNRKILQDPIIFAGDFNFEPDSLEFEMLQHVFRFEEPQSYLGLNYSCTLCEENRHYIGYQLSKALFMDYERTTDYVFFRSSPNMQLVIKEFDVFPKDTMEDTCPITMV